MFDDQLEATRGDSRALIQLAEDTEHQHRISGCHKLRTAAAWADAHSEVDHPDGGLAVERLLDVGPASCPPVAETCPASLAVAFRTSVGSAKAWIGDALNLRHRLPRLWERIVAGEVYAWKARELAHATAHLNPFTARIVDRLLHDQIELLAWTRFQRVLDATLLQVDPTTYAERQARAAAQRDVRATQSSDGLRTVIARATAGDVACFLAAVDAIAEALADEGDEDPYPVRKSKAIGILAYPRRADELLTRGAGRPDPKRDPWEQAEAHQDDPTDPWAHDLPPAGWATARHAAYHQPTPEEDWSHDTAPEEYVDWPEDPPIDDTDLDWYLGRTTTGGSDTTTEQHHDSGADDGSASADVNHDRQPADAEPADPRPADADPDPADSELPHARPADRPAASAEPAPSPAALPPAPDQQSGSMWLREHTAGLDLSRRDFGDLTKHRPTVQLHLHLTDQTVRAGAGVVRTNHGPITVDQLRHFLTDTCPNIKVYPVLDPAAVAAVDNYEIPLALRRAQKIKHPGSIFPLSPATGRLDLDHTTPYRPDGPPGQTAVATTGPLARAEHRGKTVGGWRVRQPDPGLYVWRSPEGHVSLVTNQGTLILGDTAYTQHLWRTARQRASATTTA